MHVEWNWIKQRPHFIAEYLQKNGCEVDVYHRNGYSKQLVNNETTINIKPIPRLRGLRFSIIRILNTLFYYVFLKLIIKTNKYDYIYITHPSLYSSAIKGKVIYDCMDDHTSFTIPQFERNDITQKERKLLIKANIVLFSSDYLASTIIKRYDTEPRNYIVINNAIELPNISINNHFIKSDSNKLTLTYIGTVSDWFDFNLLEEIKEKYTKKNIEYDIYGPVDNISKKSGFNFFGPIEHKKIFEVMEKSDILIMPFIVNKLIESVNPVKLYEYIYSGKPIICVKYGETEKFEKYVNLYEQRNVESFIEQIDLIMENGLKGKTSLNECFDFVNENTWENRTKQILNFIKAVE